MVKNMNGSKRGTLSRLFIEVTEQLDEITFPETRNTIKKPDKKASIARFADDGSGGMWFPQPKIFRNLMM